MRLHCPALSHPRRWPGWTGLLVLPYPRYWVECIFPLPASTVLGVLPLTNDGFRTHRAPMPAPHVIGPTTRLFAAPTDEPCLSYAICARLDTTRLPCARCTRSQTTVLTGVVRSGFAASTAPAPSPKAQLRSLPPPHSARLGSTIPLGCHASPFLTPVLIPQLDYLPLTAPLVLQTTALDNEASTKAEHLSNTLLSYSHRDWERA